MNSEYDDIYIYLTTLATKSDLKRKMDLYICFTKDYHGRDPKMDSIFFYHLSEKWQFMDIDREVSILFIDEKRDCLIDHSNVERRITNIKHYRSSFDKRMLPKLVLIDYFRDTLEEQPYLDNKCVLQLTLRKGLDFSVKSVHQKLFHKMGMIHHLNLDSIEANPKKLVSYVECNDFATSVNQLASVAKKTMDEKKYTKMTCLMINK